MPSLESLTDELISSPENLKSAGVGASFLEYLHACPICHNKDLRHYCRVPSLFNDDEFICYERCTDCGVVLRNPRLPTRYREARYEEGPIPEAAKKLKPRNQLHYAYMLRQLERLLPPSSGRRFFDFGCGAGGFLVEAEKAGFEVMGLELSKDLASHVEKTYGFEIFQGLISDPSFADQRFNLIVSSQVFEHLVDPRATLLELRRHLTPPGLLLIEVPNLRHIRERLQKGRIMDDSHLFYFSARSLPRMLEDAGFRVLKVEEGLRPYRVLGKTEPFPDWLHDLGQKIFSTVQIKTGLSVIARLDQALD